MSYGRDDYYRECIETAAEECGLDITREQADYLAGAVQGARENESMAFPAPESPYPGEIRRLKEELSKERSKVVCRECGGRGHITTYGPCHSATSQCWKCNGEGRVLP